MEPPTGSEPVAAATPDHRAQPPPVLPRAVLVPLGAAAAVVVVAGMRAAAGLVAPIVLALILTIAVTPLLDWTRRRGSPDWSGTLLALVAVYAIVAFLVVGVGLSITKLVELIPQYAPSAEALQADLQKTLADLGVPAGSSQHALDQLSPAKVLGVLTDFLTGILGALGNLFFLLTLLFFFCAEASGFRRRVAVLGRDRPQLAAALTGYATRIRRYLVVTTVFGAIVAVLDTTALWLLGIPLPLIWGLLSFVTNFVPNIGFVLGLIPPALIALLDQGWGSMLAVVAVYCVLNVVIQTFIQPRVVGESVGLSTTTAFLSLAVWAFVLGPLGALLAVPMTLLVRTLLIDPDPKARWAAVLISSETPK